MFQLFIPPWPSTPVNHSTPGNQWSVHWTSSFAFSRKSFGWDRTVCSLWLLSCSSIHLRSLHVFESFIFKTLFFQDVNLWKYGQYLPFSLIKPLLAHRIFSVTGSRISSETEKKVPSYTRKHLWALLCCYNMWRFLELFWAQFLGP